jgi:hypothetical protein
MMTGSLFGFLAALSLLAALIFVAFSYVYVNRLLRHPPSPISEEVGSVRKVLGKVRKGQPMSQDELEYAAQVIADRRSLMAFSIPAAIFSIGCFYVFGCLEQLHGARPGWHTYIGFLPMLGATNLTAQLHRIGRLKGKLRNIS